jgi:SNF2 family DNA or RNA helicase
MLDYSYKSKPFDHQHERFLLYRNKRFHGHLWEQGTGKSKVIIDTAAWLYGQGEIDCLLIIAPNGVHRGWIKDQVPDHMPDYTNYRAAWYSSSPTRKEKEQLLDVLKYRGGLKIIAINVEAFQSSKGTAFARELLNMMRCLMVVDESSTIKGHKAIRTKNIIKIGIHAPYKRILTGTPITQGPLDLYTQFTFLDSHCLRSASYYGFRNRYAIMKEQRVAGRSFMQVTGYTNLDELQEILAKHSDRVTKAECLDLPDKLYQKRYVELSDNQRRLYNALKKDLLVEFNGMKLSAPLALTKLLRLQQIVGGFFTADKEVINDYDELLDWDDTGMADSGSSVGPISSQDTKGPVAIDETNPRVTALLDLLEETQGKVIIWARFRAEIEAISQALMEKFGRNSVVEYHGGIKNEDRSRAIELFQGEHIETEQKWSGGVCTFEHTRVPIPKEKQAKYFVGHVQAGGKGLTLTAASTVVYYSNDFSLENRLQSEDRAHRIGQVNHVTYIDFIAINTLDDKVVTVLRNKKNMADIITGDEKMEEWI